jgi:hypothetical protein
LEPFLVFLEYQSSFLSHLFSVILPKRLSFGYWMTK